MMRLVNVKSARRTANAGLLDLKVIVEGYEGNPGETEIPFAWRADDPHGLGPAVTRWMADHPDTVIDDYVPPPPPDLDAIDTAALNRKLVEQGSVTRAELKTLLNHENRIRTLESRATITQDQFVTALKALMRNGA